MSGQGAGAKPGSAQGVDDFAEAHRELLQDRSIQFELSRPEVSAEQQPQAPQPRQGMPALPGAEILFWALVAVVLLFLLYMIADRLGFGAFGGGRGGGAEQEPRWRPGEGEARQLLVEADALAAAGDYSGAAHLLLFRSIEEIERRRPDALRPALTSRDIARLPVIPAAPREAFSRIAMAVERSLFAGRALRQDDWSDCRGAYEAFAFAEAWSG